jgi:hypothetical protein
MIRNKIFVIVSEALEVMGRSFFSSPPAKGEYADRREGVSYRKYHPVRLRLPPLLYRRGVLEITILILFARNNDNGLENV